MTDLFAKKTIEQLLMEAKETGEHSLKRTLGVFQLTALGVGESSVRAFSCFRDWERITPGPA